jgi:hypothetical protein
MTSYEELEQVPRLFRLLLKLLLKLPIPGFPHFVVSKLPWFEGIFWALGVPILLSIYLGISIWLVAYLSLYVAFPANILVGLSMPTIVFIFFLRLQVERALLFWRNLRNPPQEWNVSKSVDKLLRLIDEQRKPSK